MRRWRKREPDEVAALRAVVIELLSDLARRAPDPDGYLESRRAGIFAALGLGDPGPGRFAAWRGDRALACRIDEIFAEARPDG